jgi:type IV pilus assembly protein PilY1
MPAPSTDRSRNDTSIRALTAVVLLGAQLASIVPAAAGGVDPVVAEPIAPNVVLIVDVSGSMAESVPSNLYAPAKRYPVQRRCESVAKRGKIATGQPCASGAVFNGPTHVRYADSVATVSGSGVGEARTALAESGNWSGAIQGRHVTLYTGNYVNYLVGSCAIGGACPESKLTSVKRIIGSLVDTVRGVRFGVMTFHYGAHGARGGRMIAPVGSQPSAIKDAVNALAPARDAPLGDALYDAGQYFKGEPLTSGTAVASPIQRGCQPNHIVLITSGTQASGSRSLTAEAMRRQNQDHATSLPELQRVSVHTLGFRPVTGGVSSAADRVVAELKRAAENGGGTFAQATSARDVETSLRATLARITDATYSLANPVLPTSTTAGGRRAYVTSFQPSASTPFWRGSLQAYQRDANGIVPVDAQGVPLASALIWDAGSILNRLAPANRTIYTEIGGRLTPFTRNNSAITRAMLGVASAAERDRVIGVVRGGSLNAGNRAGGAAPDRPWKLGAIIHSTPVLVSAPTLALSDPGYRAFKAAQTKRTTVLIVGANDGMLHAFRERDGVEVWAFVPPDMLDRLRGLAAADGAPAVFVDGSPIAVDIKVAGTWKTIVIFGGRRGSASYYALDITDTMAPSFLWRFSDPKIHETWSQPTIGKVKLAGVDTFVAFVGGGRSPSSDTASGNTIMALDVATGRKLWEYAATSDAAADRRYMTFGVAASPAAVDADGDGYVERVYVGDVGGQLWKFDVSAGDIRAWKGKRLFAPAAPNVGLAISAAPALAFDHLHRLWLFFGTGGDDPNATSGGRFYGLKDDTDMANGAAVQDSDARFKDVTAANVAAAQGWYVILRGRGEIPVGAATVFNGTVLFSTFTPDPAGVCGPGGGTTKLYALDPSSGSAKIDFAAGTTLTRPTPASPRFKDIGPGVGSTPIVVLTAPVTPGAPPTASVVTATSRQALASTPIPAPAFLKQVRSWRER